jgi:hypothetical protein
VTFVNSSYRDAYLGPQPDVTNVCRWACRHGVACDAGEVFAEVVAEVF